VATVLGVIVGLPALRVRGLYVAVVTLSLAVVVDALWFRNTDVVGFAGGVRVNDPTLFGWYLGFGQTRGANHLSFGFLVLATLVLTAVGVAILRRSRLGSAMVAVRANERSAAAAGVDVVRIKVAAFAIASFIAGIGGAMLAYRFGTITSDQFAPLVGLTLFTTAYLAGITSVSGGVVAGLLCLAGVAYTASSHWLHLGKWYQLISAFLVIFTVINNPEGIVGPNHLMADKFAAKRKERRRRGAPSERPRARTAELVAEPIDVSNLPALLEIRNLHVNYGGVVAIDDVSFDVPEGAIVGLIGPNGAGKTTAIDALSGFAHHRGTVRFGEAPLAGLKPHQRVKLGLSRTFQAIELYDDLTVQENLEVGLTGGRRGGRGAAAGALDSACEVLGLTDFRDRQAADLSQGQRQLVSIGRALVGKPRLLLLDEPAAGLDSSESSWLGLRLREVRSQGVTILMVDHDVNLVLTLCDYIIVLDFGRLIAAGTPNQIRADPTVISAYLGSTHSEPVTAHVEGDPS
jgi:ABC-type branched-subunit amino acid transport system ATPase component/ABC-type branched-subunit amino acid transport system permease subunit